MFDWTKPPRTPAFAILALFAVLLLQTGCDSAISLPTANEAILTSEETVLAAPAATPSAISTLTRSVERCGDVLSGASSPVQTMLNNNGVIAGGDDLSTGSMTINRSSGSVEINITGTHELNLYEVYWVAFSAGSIATDAILMGNFVTDTSGSASGELLRDIDSPSDITSASATNHITVKTNNGYRRYTPGWYLFYSRGPYATDSNNNGVIDSGEYNLGGDGTTFANPTLGSLTNGVQYVSTR